MDLLYFIIMFSCLSAVAFWYIQNERTGGDGHRGVLGIKLDALAGDDGEERESDARYQSRDAGNQKAGALSEKESVRRAAQEATRPVAKKYKTAGSVKFKSRGGPYRHRSDPQTRR
ncbi:MAG: hypothetical protein AAGJ73_07560 [Pseudomonadota bacterium]